MTEKNNKLQNTRRNAPLHAALRIIISILLQAMMFYSISGVEGNDYDFNAGLNAFLFALLPAVSIVILLPVLIRGTPAEKIFAGVLALPAAWFAFMGWAAVIGRLFG